MFIGRERELQTFHELFKKNSASFVVITGRRRIGKSRLIEEFGTQRVIVKSLNFSYAEILSFFERQKVLQFSNDSSFSTSFKDTLPIKPVLLKIFSSIQAEAEPHTTKINCEFFLK